MIPHSRPGRWRSAGSSVWTRVRTGRPVRKLSMRLQIPPLTNNISSAVFEPESLIYYEYPGGLRMKSLCTYSSIAAQIISLEIILTMIRDRKEETAF